jgi:hypothetical protein
VPTPPGHSASGTPSRSSSSPRAATPIQKSGVPLQSSSSPLQSSRAAGLIARTVSSQSFASSTWPATGSHDTVVPLAALPKPSPSVSRYQVVDAGLSSVVPSQSLSTPSHTSTCAACRAGAASSQSSSALDQPGVPGHAMSGIDRSPCRSRSASTKPGIATPSSTVPSQSSSIALHDSATIGLTVRRKSSQSSPHASAPSAPLLQHRASTNVSRSRSRSPTVAASQSSSCCAASQISALPGKRIASASSQSSPPHATVS